MDRYFGALGGGVHAYGVVWRDNESLSINDRDMIEEWIQNQPIECRVRLGELEELNDTDVLRDFSDLSRCVILFLLLPTISVPADELVRVGTLWSTGISAKTDWNSGRNRRSMGQLKKRVPWKRKQ